MKWKLDEESQVIQETPAKQLVPTNIEKTTKISGPTTNNIGQPINRFGVLNSAEVRNALIEFEDRVKNSKDSQILYQKNPMNDVLTKTNNLAFVSIPTLPDHNNQSPNDVISLEIPLKKRKANSNGIKLRTVRLKRRFLNISVNLENMV